MKPFQKEELQEIWYISAGTFDLLGDKTIEIANENSQKEITKCGNDVMEVVSGEIHMTVDAITLLKDCQIILINKNCVFIKISILI